MLSYEENWFPLLWTLGPLPGIPNSHRSRLPPTGHWPSPGRRAAWYWWGLCARTPLCASASQSFPASSSHGGAHLQDRAGHRRRRHAL